jgi:cytoskeletal protein RodZ
MPTLGEELRRRREERGTTLAEISEATRIGTRFLKAIESDNFSVLPGGIYTRNFIRSYAERVGMEEDAAIALYHQQVSGQSGESPQPSPAESTARPTREPQTRPETVAIRPNAPPRTNWSTIVIAAGVLLIILIIAVSLVQRLNRAQTEGETQSGRDSAAPAASTPPNQPESASKPSQTETAPTQTTRPQAPDLPPNEPIAVRLEAATGPSSIVYWIDDDTKSTNLFLLEGESRDLPPAQKEVRLSIGNRMTLKLKINQREATFPAELPKFKSRVTISRDNVKSFFP